MAIPTEILELAAQYHATGNFELAEQYAASVLDDEPNNAAALHLLGLIARQKGKPQEAIVYLNRSLTANGSNAAAWQLAGDILLAGGDVPGCITYYEQVMRLRPDFAEGYNTLGQALLRVGQLARAIECFRRATLLAPSFAPAHNNLGSALRKLSKWAEAAAAFEQALLLWPENPDIAFNLGNTRFDQGDVSAAIACYRRALSLKPAYAAEVSNSLATALKVQKLWDEAVAQYQETLRLRPGHPMALYNLSELAAAGRYVFPPEELAHIKEDLASGHGGETDRSLSAFAVANVLHLQGAFDEAFRFYREANDLQMRLLKKRKAAFDARAHQAGLDKIMAEQGETYFETVKDWGIRAELPVFVIGLPCSGATRLAEILAGHPEVRDAGTAGSVPRFLAQFAADNRFATNTSLLLPDLPATRAAAANYLHYLAQFGQGAARVIVNSRDNVQGLGMIATLFPGARVIHCRRKLLDVAVACYFQYRPDLPFAWSLEDLGAYCLAHEQLMAHWTRTLPLQIHEVNFEALIDERDKSSRELFAFCGLDWDEKMGASESDQACAPVGVESIGLSQHYRAHLGQLAKALNC